MAEANKVCKLIVETAETLERALPLAMPGGLQHVSTALVHPLTRLESRGGRAIDDVGWLKSLTKFPLIFTSDRQHCGSK